MEIDILVSDTGHPVVSRLHDWADSHGHAHRIRIIHETGDLAQGDFLFLVSCHERIESRQRDEYEHVLVLHASDLPHGRGWSPHIWQILQGKNEIVMTLFEASDGIDRGDIWAKRSISLDGHELYDEINNKLFETEIALIDHAVQNAGTIKPQPQPQMEEETFKKRSPEDSRLNPEKTIAEQFDLLRIADPDRYPAFFDYRGERYYLTISRKVSDND